MAGFVSHGIWRGGRRDLRCSRHDAGVLPLLSRRQWVHPGRILLAYEDNWKGRGRGRHRGKHAGAFFEKGDPTMKTR